MTVLCFLHSMAYVIPHHAQFLQMLTGNRRELSRATSKFDNIGFSSATRNLQIRRIQDKSTLWRGFRCRFRLGDLLISCGRKADSCKKKFGSKNIRVLVNGAVPT